MITPDQFTSGGVAWVDAGTTVLLEVCGKLLLVIAAGFGVIKAFKQGDAALRGRVDALETTADAHTAAIAANAAAIVAAPAPNIPPSIPPKP